MKNIIYNKNKKCPKCNSTYLDYLEKEYKSCDDCKDYYTVLKNQDLFINNSEEDVKEVIDSVLKSNIKTPVYRYG